MENKMTNSLIEVENTSLTPIEIALGVDNEGRTTATKLYNFLDLDKSHYSRWTKKNIEENEFADINIDYWPLAIDGERNPNPTQDYKLSASFAKKLAVGTHNSRGEAAKDYFIKVEDRLKQQSIAINQLSPSLQMFAKLFDSVAQQELEHKQLKKEVTEAKEEAAAVKQEVQDIRDVVTISTFNNWRDDTNKAVAKICKQLGDYQKPKDEIYKALEQRASCDLKIRLKNMRARLALEGASRTKLNNMNYLDVIAEDKKLIEIYTAIVKEMAIKYKPA